ncbi:MAG: sigma-70 family RNA polymerase sigma factor [Clostridia bacterium]|nr:sigma-70 family RNA polymerase sigma factor [Clostridia bacterium]
MIIGEIRRYLRDYNPIRVSRSLRDTAYHAMQIKERIQNTLGRDATIEEIAKEMEIEPVNVIIALEAIVEPISLYEPVYSDGGDTIYVMDQVGSSESDEDWLYEIAIKEAINNLSDREKQILNLRFMQGKTQMEVAQEVGISQAQVSRLEKGAIKKVKEF